MKYDSVYHKNVVDNYRRGFVARYGYPLTISDERIWEIQEDCQFCEDYENETYESLKEEEDCNSL